VEVNMQTETISAWQLEKGDYITLGSETVWQVVEATDSPADVTVVLKDEDGELHDDNPLSFVPWDSITLVTSFEDDADAYYV
jgi:hypothetical protein